MDKVTIIPSDILERFNDPVGPAESAATVRNIMSVPADEIPKEEEFLKNPKGRPRQGADFVQQPTS